MEGLRGHRTENTVCIVAGSLGRPRVFLSYTEVMAEGSTDWNLRPGLQAGTLVSKSRGEIAQVDV